MIPDFFSLGAIVDIIECSISGIIILIYLIYTVLGRFQTQRLKIWWRVLLIFLCVQQVIFISSYVIDFGDDGDQMCCSNSVSRLFYMTVIKGLLGDHALYYFGFFFARESLMNIQSKYKSLLREHKTKTNVVAAAVLVIDLGYIFYHALYNQMTVVQSFAGLLMPSPGRTLFYFDCAMNLVTFVFIIYLFYKFKKRGFGITSKDIMNQTMMSQYVTNFQIPKKIIEFIIINSFFEMSDNILTAFSHFVMNDYGGDKNIMYIYISLRYLFLLSYVLVPPIFMYSQIFQGKPSKKMHNLAIRKDSAGELNLEPLLNTLDIVDDTKEVNLSGNLLTHTESEQDMVGLFQISDANYINFNIVALLITLRTLELENRKVGQRRVTKTTIDHEFSISNIEKIRQADIEHKTLYHIAALKVDDLRQEVEDSWGESTNLSILHNFKGVLISYFEGTREVSVWNNRDFEEMFIFFYGYIKIKKADLGSSDLTNYSFAEKEIQFITKQTKFLLLKTILKEFWLEKEKRISYLQDIKGLFSYSPSKNKNASFIVLENRVKHIHPVCCYKVGERLNYYCEWSKIEKRFVSFRIIQKLHARHSIILQDLLEVLNKDMQLLKRYSLREYQIKLLFYKTKEVQKKEGQDAPQFLLRSTNGEYLCEVVIRRIFAKNILQFMSTKTNNSEANLYADRLKKSLQNLLE